ncbi:hypothetical protein M501DRAFT_1003364, partial [Patellaria atrata CBS 101060]
MDAELFAILKALEREKTQPLKRLQKNSLDEGQELSVMINDLCNTLTNEWEMKITFSWVPGHKNIFGNDIADKLAKKGLGRKPIGTSFTSLSYIKRK